MSIFNICNDKILIEEIFVSLNTAVAFQYI